MYGDWPNLRNASGFRQKGARYSGVRQFVLFCAFPRPCKIHPWLRSKPVNVMCPHTLPANSFLRLGGSVPNHELIPTGEWDARLTTNITLTRSACTEPRPFFCFPVALPSVLSAHIFLSFPIILRASTYILDQFTLSRIPQYTTHPAAAAVIHWTL
jgi:hypothetical protein